MSPRLIVLSVGDVAACRPAPETILARSAARLRQGDISFAQLESCLSDRGEIVPNARLAMRGPPAFAATMRAAGIDVVSMAGNHCLDWGYTALRDTADHVFAAGIKGFGVGANLAEAWAPVIIDARGRRVAFLGGCSILPEGYAARDDKAGCAAVQAYTIHVASEPDQPGGKTHTLTRAEPRDLAQLQTAVRAARAQADHVVLSMHWGIHMQRAIIADYEHEIAHAAIDAGADAVLGHHPHILKGVSFYRDRPIFHSLGNFAIEQPHVWDPEIVKTASFRHLRSLNPTWNMDQLYMLPRETRASGIARLEFGDSDAPDVYFEPAWIEDDSAPTPLAPDDALFTEVARYLEDISREAGFSTEFTIEDGALRLRAQCGDGKP